MGTPNFSSHRVHYVSIAVNASGIPYVAYSHFENTPNNKNYVFKFNGTVWEQVGADPVSSGEAKWNALLFDNSGTPLLAYSDESMSTGGNMVKKFVPGTTANNIDSVRVHTQNNIAPIVTSHMLAPQPTNAIQLEANVFPSSASQAVNWSVPAGNAANSTVSATGLVTVPTQTQGLAWIKATSSIDATKSDSLQLQVYCQPSHTNPINWFVIDTVEISGTTLLNTVTALGNANAYQIFQESGSNTATLEIGNTYNLKSHVTFSYGVANAQEMSYSLWIDYNRNGIFESTEWTGIASSTLDSVLSGTFTIPTTATEGKTLMRVRSRIAGAINGPADACAAFNGSGQTKDFIITLAAGTSTACNNTMPATTAGSTGCVTFNYQGAPVTYTTVRANDGNVWLQQNLGSTQVGNAKTDTSAYGHLFQWGRWDDGHQLRTSTPGAVPVPNNPTGIGTGSATYYAGSSTNAWWNGGALSDSWTAASNTQATATDGCDPCKAMGAGWRLPTETEWAGLVSSETMTNTNTAFASNLKLVIGGSRSSTDGAYNFVGIRGYYWSSTTSSTGAKYLYYSDAIVNASAGNTRGGGAAVRCIYSQSVGVSAIDVTTQNNVAATITTNAGTLQMEATILPASVNQAATWSIVPVTGAATISATGFVTAQSNGTVWAKAISVADATKMDSLEITISNQSNCVAVSVINENFDTQPVGSETISNLPDCWAIYKTSSGYGYIDNFTSASASKSVHLNNQYLAANSPDELILVSPQTTNLQTGNYRVRFKARHFAGSNQIRIVTLNAQSSIVGMIEVDTINTTGAWAEYTINLPAGTNSYFGFAHGKNSFHRDIFIDDVVYELIPPVSITSVDVATQNNVAASISTFAGTLQMTATVLPVTANQSVTWSIVPGTGTAAISITGLVTAQSNGTVWAKAISVADATKMDSLEITISNQVTLATSIDVITQNNVPATITTNAGTLQMAATILPAAANQDVTWSIIPATGSATISATGLVTAQSNGTVWAKANAVSNSTLADSLLITISNQHIAVEDITVSTINNVPATITMNSGILPLQAIVTPTNATNSAVTWSIIPVSGTASISSTGVVTAETNGTVYAKAVSVDNTNISDSLLITISGQGVGIKEISKGLSFDLHPNPARTYMIVSLPLESTASLAIISIDGRVVLQSTFVGKNTKINISNIAKGNYLVRVQTKDGYAIKKLVIE